MISRVPLGSIFHCVPLVVERNFNSWPKTPPKVSVPVTVCVESASNVKVSSEVTLLVKLEKVALPKILWSVPLNVTVPVLEKLPPVVSHVPETVAAYKTVTEYWTQNTHYFNNSGGTPVSGFTMTVAQSFRLRTSPETSFSRIVECRHRRNGKHRFFKRSSFSCPRRYNTPLTLGFAPTSSDTGIGASRPLHEFRRRNNYYYTADPAKISAGIPDWIDNGVFAYVWF